LPGVLLGEMATLIDIKNYVSNQLGVDSGATSNTIRDRFIIFARRKFYSEYQWSFLDKVVVPAFTANQASLPADFNTKFKPKTVWAQSGIVKIMYTLVDIESIQAYPDTFVYALDIPNLKIVINRSDYSPSLLYTYLPVDPPLNNTQDNVVEPASDITAIAYAAISSWWLASERSNARFQLFDDKYQEELQKMKLIDSKNVPILSISSLPANIGYTRANRSSFNGYVPR
jgi:hypothetical protein